MLHAHLLPALCWQQTDFGTTPCKNPECSTGKEYMLRAVAVSSCWRAQQHAPEPRYQAQAINYILTPQLVAQVQCLSRHPKLHLWEIRSGLCTPKMGHHLTLGLIKQCALFAWQDSPTPVRLSGAHFNALPVSRTVTALSLPSGQPAITCHFLAGTPK